MKPAGMTMLIVGVIISLYTGVHYMTKEKVVDFATVEITEDNQQAASWSPIFGIGVMVVGGAVLALGGKISLPVRGSNGNGLSDRKSGTGKRNLHKR